MNILYLSNCMPYDKISHAGGQAHNFYLKKLCSYSDVNLVEVAITDWKEYEKQDLDEYNIRNIPVLPYKNIFIRKIYYEAVKWPISDCYGRMQSFFAGKRIVRIIRRLLEEGFLPDIVIAEWTQVVVLIPELKELISSAKFIAVERDVSYLGYKRRYQNARTKKEKEILLKRYECLKQIELNALHCSDLVCPNNYKDRDLLLKDGISPDKIHVLSPYYKKHELVNGHNATSKNIVFYGAMGRPENYQSAIWFAENVLYKLKDSDYKFYIVGSNPSPELDKIKSDRVIVTGFVDDIREYFQDAFCVVVPLQLGAGIKIKVLESLYMGVPVLTNHIGIEGICPDGAPYYLHCEVAEDYIHYLNERTSIIELGNKGRNYIEQKFNYEKSVEDYYQILKKMIPRK